MINILLCGCFGRMGSLVRECAASERFRDSLKIVCGTDITNGKADFPVYKSLDDVTFPVDVLIDFSSPALTDSICAYSAKYSVPCVLATTGRNDLQKKSVIALSEKVAVFEASNFSEGVHLTNKLVKAAAETLGSDFDAEIVEYHHNRKADSPSGTALTLAETVKGVGNGRTDIITDRFEAGKREKGQISIASVRGGNIAGRHEVMFIGDNETVTIIHEANNRKIFADGALKAALSVAGKGPGLYGMDSLD